MIFDSAKNLDFYRGLGIEGRYDKACLASQNHPHSGSVS